MGSVPSIITASSCWYRIAVVAVGGPSSATIASSSFVIALVCDSLDLE